VRTIAHISDLHFGREDPAVVEALVEDLAEHPPSLVAVSGDLTQRARRGQFAAARRFLGRLPAPVVAVPGNHDLPLFNLPARIAAPLWGYRRHVAADPEPFVHDEELAVMGVNTARRAKWKDGRLSRAQIARIRDRFGPIPERVFKVVITHHPFVPAPGTRDPALVSRGFEALQAAESAGVDLLLAGHLHVGFSGDVRPHYLSIRRSMLVAQAGTATSNRHRGEPNTYNRITIEPPHLTIEVRMYGGGRFARRGTTFYVKRGDEWTRE
jgi:3',5'-cyclic AMP phosphodiesterase CpdA